MRLTILAALVALTSHASPREIVQQSIVENEANWAEAPTYSHIERDARHAGDGVETAQTFDVLIIEGSPYNKLIALNDQPLSREQQAEEERKLRQEINKRQHEPARARDTRIAKSRRELDQNRAMLKAMTEAFDYRLQGDQDVDGHDTWVLEAVSKPGYRPRDRDTRILAGMKGTLWIDKASDQWVRVEAEVIAPVSLLGVLAKVEPGTRFVLEQEPVSATLWLPKHFSVKVKATVLGMIHRTYVEDETYSRYRIDDPLCVSRPGLPALPQGFVPPEPSNCP